ncbi:MAG: alpha/beta fold hydrolase [Nitrospirae bacterium]|nr:MAG: alpha/beta fold hydrolase [Nitrospirota bacterium]
MYDTRRMRRNPAKRSGLLDGMVSRQRTDVAFQTDSNVVVYLIHGVTGTPAEMGYLARQIAHHRWDVYATTLPGHCTRLRALLKTSEQDWVSHVHAQLVFMRERYDYVFVAGLSAGGLLALLGSLAVNVDGIGVLSPTIIYDGWNTPWTHAILPFAMKVVPRPLQHVLFHVDGPPFGIKDDVLQARVRAAYSPIRVLREWLGCWWAGWKTHGDTHTLRPPAAALQGFPLFPLKTLTDIDRLIKRVRARMGEVTAPTVILQARDDDMTSPRNAYLVHDEIASKEKRLVLLDDCYHVITVDKQQEAVARHLIEFFEVQASRQT